MIIGLRTPDSSSIVYERDHESSSSPPCGCGESQGGGSVLLLSFVRLRPICSSGFGLRRKKTERAALKMTDGGPKSNMELKNHGRGGETDKREKISKVVPG